MKRIIPLLVVAGLVFALAPAASGVTICLVKVGNAGNTGESHTAGGNLTAGHPVFGAVSYEYFIGTYEVSNAQYAEFLNAVAKNDSNLYNPSMGTDPRGGITRSGSAGSYTYAVKPNMGDKPVNYVFASDAARFANWLHNGQPTTGVQDDTTTEDGAYDMPSVGYNDNFKTSITRDAGWQWALPNLDEWHKAAYHKNDGVTGNYWDYATGTDSAPTAVTANGTGDGSAGATGNFANFGEFADWNSEDGNVTTVGSNGGPSPYGTYDQNGNIGEWNEEMWDGNKGSFAGANYGMPANWLSMVTADLGNTKNEGPSIGFRVVSLVPPPGICITKTVSETAVNLDQGATNLSYTITLANGSTSSLGGLVVTDSLPAEVSFVTSAPPAVVTNGNEIIFNVGTLEAGSNVMFTIEVSVTSTVPGIITNVAAFGVTNTNVTVNSGQDTAVTLLYYPADLDVTKTAVVSGTNVDYTIIVNNLGLGDATDVSVVDTLPIELIFQSASLPPSIVGNDYTFNLGTLLAGSNATLMISAVYTSTVSIFVTNSATASTTWFEDNMANNTGTVITPVGGGLVLLKSVSTPSVNLDLGPTNLIYTLDILNTHTVSLSGIVVTDALPVGVGFVTSTPTAGQTNGNAYTFDVGTLGPGSNALITLEVALTSAVPGVITNFAFTLSTNTNVAAVSGQDFARTLLFFPTDISVTKDVSRFESNYFYTIIVSNQSVTPASNVVAVDSLPAGSVFDSSVPVPTSISGDDYTFNLGLLSPGATSAITLSITYTSTTPAFITNIVTVSTDTAEDNLADNTAVALAPTANTNVELVLTKTVSPTDMMVGDSNLTYTITIMNISTAFAGSVVVTDSLPSSVQYLSSSLPASQTNGNSYTFNIDVFGAGATTSIVINAAYTSSTPGVITNWATVVGTNTELTLANNTDFALTTITNGGPPCVPGVDTDGDGMTDCEEICAGTNPNDPNSFLWIEIARTGTHTVRQLTFPTTTGRMYRVDLNTNLYSNDWTTVISNLPGIGTDRNVMHTSSATRVYYRIGVESP